MPQHLKNHEGGFSHVEAALVIVVVAVIGLITLRVSHADQSKKSPPSSNAFNVVAYGADPSGQRDSTLAIRTALSSAEMNSGNTVYFPAGRYILDLNDGAHQDFNIASNPVTIKGAGRNMTTIVEKIGAKTAGVKNSKVIFQILTGPNGQPGGADGTIITGLTLDSASYDAGTTIMDFANNTAITNDTIQGARSDSRYNPDAFGLRLLAICDHTDLSTKHRSGNEVNDLILSGQGSAGNTDLDISCQINTSVSNVVDTGNGMDIYIANQISVNNYTFTPGTIESSPKSYIITGPTNGLTLNNITTYGNGGHLHRHQTATLSRTPPSRTRQ